MPAAKSIMILGTGSDVGKSIVATALCRILRNRGVRVAPFKAQNMSNNSFVTIEGGEIGRAQVAQAEASGLPPSVHMNPVLLKPSSDRGSQVILQGRVYGQMEAAEYHAGKSKLRKVVLESFHRLSQSYDAIVMEGAGSCCEMNLKDRDLVNFPMARAVGASCLLVGDIDRGGIFAQLLGSHHLMTRKERELTAGFLINKFRGDPRLFDSGMAYIEKKSGKPVLGLVPYYHDIAIDPEDSVAVQEDRRVLHPLRQDTLNIGVLRLPSISNFTDLETLAREPGVVLNYLFRPDELDDGYDLLILPGAKNVMEDAAWLARSGWRRAVRRFANRGKRVLGICGGYQLLGRLIHDPFGVESDRPRVEALGLLPAETVLAEDKVVQRVTGTCLMNRKRVTGYEIHMGRTEPAGPGARPLLRVHRPGSAVSWDDGLVLDDGRVLGSYVHGVLDAPGFRGELLNTMRREKGLRERASRKGRLARFHQYDRLAEHFERCCDVDRILSLMS
ncbi:MAG: cobyric acid synthase [Deltaproteobacteria bacterium]|nr:cobyric acid synthase [Deltaproteobacteria bacterium]